MTVIALFVSVSVVLAYISRRSLMDPRVHGFYRYFAWECIVALVCVNFVSLEHWFRDPFSARQIASWAMLFCSLVPVTLGTHELRVGGKPDVAKRRESTALLNFETTTELVTSGIFSYVRHPMYSSLLLLAWGVFLKRPFGLSAGLVVGATAFLVTTALVEEAENVRFFGERYRTYQRSTRRFVPFVW